MMKFKELENMCSFSVFVFFFIKTTTLKSQWGMLGNGFMNKK